MNSKIKTDSPDNISFAAECIKDGKTVIIPTETVYGLVADATNSDAIRQIYSIKERSEDQPLQILVDNIENARKIGDFNDLPMHLAEKFWPGPLTIIVRRLVDAHMSYLATGGQMTVGIRVPESSVAQKILKQVARPVVATSANVSGGASPVFVKDIPSGIINKVSLVIDGDRSKIGISSTVVDVTGDKVKILREGSINKEQVFDALIP